MRRWWRALIIVQILVACGGSFAWGGDEVYLTRHTAVLTPGALQVSCRWLSANPVVVLKLTVGGEEKSLAVDPAESFRTGSGYEGGVSVSVPADPAGQERLSYSLVVADGAGNESSAVSGRLPVAPGQGVTRSLRAGGAASGESPPSLAPVRVNKGEGNLVSFSTVATDDKGLHELRFRVLDAQGRQVRQVVLNSLGTYWQGTTEKFLLPIGSYTVSAQAIDSSGNASAEQTSRFALYDPPQLTWKVTLQLKPLEAAGNGAMWQLDNGPWKGSGASARALPGRHRITFKDAAGWRAPEPITVNVGQGGVSSSATYQRDAGAQSRGLAAASSYRLVRIPVAEGGEETRSLTGQGGYYLKITSQSGLGEDMDRIAAEVAEKVGGQVVDPGALDQTRSAFGDSARRDASIELKAKDDSRFPFVAAIDLFCYGTSLFKLNLCKNSADVATKVASAIGGVVTKVYDVYNTVFGQPAEGAPEPPKPDAPAPAAQE